MNSQDIVGYVQALEFENRKLKEENNELKGRKIDAGRFYAATMTVKEISSLHNVDPATVRRYIKNGYIKRHPKSTDARILVRASDAVTLDFGELRTMNNH